jgi:hypothetical protein
MVVMEDRAQQALRRRLLAQPSRKLLEARNRSQTVEDLVLELYRIFKVAIAITNLEGSLASAR